MMRPRITSPILSSAGTIPFELVKGVPTYFGVPVETRHVAVGSRNYEITGLCDAADLLDHPEFAERFVEDDLAPYGLQLWSSSIVLAEWLASLGGTGRAIELGCGLGLVSIVLADVGWDVLATDHDPAALLFAEHNANRNGVRLAGIERHDWHELPEWEAFDLVVGSDLAYQVTDQGPLLTAIRSLLNERGRAYLCDPRRSVADSVPERAGELNLHSVLVASSSTSAARIWEFKRIDSDAPTGGGLRNDPHPAI